MYTACGLISALCLAVHQGREATHNERDDGYHRGRHHSRSNEEFESGRRGNAIRDGGGECSRSDRRPRHCTKDDDDDYHRYRDRGRASSTSTNACSSGSNKRPHKRLKQKRAWPPPFDTDGALYVFDSRSGFFYEAESNFYYDPKSRYYYSIDAAAYFQYCPDQEPPFRKISPQQEEETSQEMVGKGEQKKQVDKHTIGSVEQTSLTTAKSKSEGEGGGSGKMKIAISLKTKDVGAATSSLKSPTDTCMAGKSTVGREGRRTSPMTESHGITRMQAQTYDADIAKWNDARSSNTTTSTIRSSSQSTPDSAPVAGVVNTHNTPRTTRTGQPICLLCKRKFADAKALQKHEQSSALHKQNLARKKRDSSMNTGNPKPAGAGSSGKSLMDYRDRAKDRRSMYGLESSHGGVAAQLKSSTTSSTGSAGGIISSATATASAVYIGPSLEKARSVASAEVVRPSDALGDSNIGSQMLKKLGWKEGSSLGRKESLEAGGSSDGGRGRGADANMQKEWETIERAAAASSSQIAAARGGTNNDSLAGVGAWR